MIIRFRLPESLASPVQNQVCLPGSMPLERLQRYSPSDRHSHYRGDFRPKEMPRSFPSGIEIAIHPNKGLAIGILSGRRKQRYGQASVQMPCDKEPFTRRMDVWQSASRETHRGIVGLRDANSPQSCRILPGKERRDESRRRGHECPRHTPYAVRLISLEVPPAAGT